jgi:hypothetical protein
MLLLLVMLLLFHLFTGLGKLLLYFAGSGNNGNDQVENQPEPQISEESIEDIPENHSQANLRQFEISRVDALLKLSLQNDIFQYPKPDEWAKRRKAIHIKPQPGAQ